MADNFLKKKIIITGASGFIGSHLVKYLSTKKLNVIGYYRNHNTRINNLKIKKNVINLNSYSEIPYSKDAILIHLAQHSKVNNIKRKNDESLSRTLVNKNFFFYIYFSSALVYGDQNKLSLSEKNKINPNSSYSKMKIVNENYFNLKKSLILRLTNIYGKYMNKDNIFRDIITQLGCDNSVKIRNGSPVREFLYIRDLCELIFLILKNPIYGVYNVGSRSSISIKNLTFKIIKNYNNKILDIKETNKTNINSSVILNSDKIMKKLNWKPKVNLNAGIKELIK